MNGNDKKALNRITKLAAKITQSELKGHCIKLKYYADGIHYSLTPPG